MQLRHYLLIGGTLAVVLLATAAMWRPAIATIEPPEPATFDNAAVMRGAGLARVGNCLSCHAGEAGPLAGGRPLKSPFGTIHATNITPDRDTGIGTWSLAAFERSMREGVARDGRHLYPAFPYDHFRQVSSRDIADLYAFLMTRDPVSASPPANRLIPPLGFRPLLAFWKLLYLRDGASPTDTAQSTDWTRGRELVEGLAHCGACHTPRNALGAEKRDRAYDGGLVEGWYAAPLNDKSPAVRAWTAERLFIYLRTGLSQHHAAAAGPMGDVTRQLATAPEAEVRAIAVYVASLMANAPGARDDLPAPDNADAVASTHPEGAALFAGACASCHEPGAPTMLEGRPHLALGTALHEDNPRDTIHILLRGVTSPAGRAGPTMPGFDVLTDPQIALIADYLRARFTDKPPWRDLPREVAEARKESAP